MVFFSTTTLQAHKRGEDLRQAGGGKGPFLVDKNRVLGTLVLGVPIHDKIVDDSFCRTGQIEMVTTTGTGTGTGTGDWDWQWTGKCLGCNWGLGRAPCFFWGSQRRAEQSRVECSE